MTNTEDVIELTRQLVQLDSSDPGEYEGALSRRLQALLGALPGVRTEALEALPGRTELKAEIPGTGPGPALVFICHMDTVPLGEGWDIHPPLGAVLEGDRLYGRGACDMKSGLACALSAFARMAARAQTQPPARTLRLICTVDEEDFMRGVEAAIRAGWVSAQDWVLDTEPTDGQIQVAHKGRLWFEVAMQGCTAHASTPWKGADANAALAEAIVRIRQGIAACPPHPELGRTTVTFGQMQGGYRPYVVPDKASLSIDMRLAPPTDAATATALVEGALRAAEQTVPGVQASYTITGNRPYIERDDASPLLAALRAAVQAATGQPAEVGIFPGYTDTAVIAGQLGNHTCLSYGPGSLELAHKPEESVPVADILRCRAVLTELAQQLLFGADGSAVAKGL